MTKLFDFIKQELLKRLLKKEVADLANQRADLKLKELNLENKIKETDISLAIINIRKRKLKSCSINDAVRHNMKALVSQYIDGAMWDTVDNAPSVLDECKSKDAEKTFLMECKKLFDNKALGMILNNLTRNQVLHGVKETESFEQMNFARATLNGLALFKDSVEYYHGRFLKMNEKEEPYDDKAVL